MPSPYEPLTQARVTFRERLRLSPRLRGPAAACLALVGLLLGGCSTPAEQPQDPRSVGDRTVICEGRVAVSSAEAVLARDVGDLLLTNDFNPTQRVGGCSLQTPDGALLDVQVFNDPDGSKLARELQELTSLDNYTGDDTSAVAGEGITSTAFVAIDAKNYVRVIGLNGISDDQRNATLALAEAVAAFSKKLK